MEDRPTWEMWFPLNQYVSYQKKSFWIAFAAYLVVPLVVTILMLIAGKSVPILALIIGVFDMPILFYSIVGIFLALATYKKAVRRREQYLKMQQKRNEDSSR